MAELISNERVDDIPLLLSQMRKLELSEQLDEHFKTHGHWQGLSLGQVVVGWLSYILSQGDHRLNQVEGWAAELSHTLKTCLEPSVRSLDFSDDRLASVLDELSQDEEWEAFEGALNSQTLRVYDLHAQTVRLDTTTVSGYRTPSSDGLFQFGHSKDYRPDLPQVKISQAALDPLGMPVSTSVVSGNRADDPLYVPEIQQVQRHLPVSGLLYVGDAKMAAIETRGYLAKSQNHYLCPLPAVQVSQADLAELLAPVFRGEESLELVPAPGASASDKETTEKLAETAGAPIAEGFALTMPQSLGHGPESFTWREQWLVVRSFKHQQRQQKGLDQRLEKAREEIANLNVTGRGRKRRSVDETIAAAENILKRYRVTSVLSVTSETTCGTIHKRAYRDQPGRTLTKTIVSVTATLDTDAYQQAQRLLGWRVYVSNDLELSLSAAVYGYRNEYRIERCFGRYKGKALGLAPLFLASDQRVKGLIRLLSLGLRILCLLEFSVRSALNTTQQTLPGLYAGNPKRATANPTAELLLKAFRGITLTVMKINGTLQYFLSALSQRQQRILQLLKAVDDVYLSLTG
jgi:transposase